jgi:hypothetical protein
VPDHDVSTGHDAAACIDDDARIVDVVPRWPNAALAETRSIEVTRTANKPLMPTLSPRRTQSCKSGKLAIDERASPLSNRCSRRKPTGASMCNCRQALTVEHFAAGRFSFHLQYGMRHLSNCIDID